MNAAASIASRLAAIAKSQQRDHSFVLVRYGIERLLWRLSQSEACDDFVVKGATLFQLWDPGTSRPTRDLDLLGRGDPSQERIRSLFVKLCAMDTEPEDGLVFHADSIETSVIKEEEEYEGVRVRLRSTLARTRIDIQVDFGFGDAVIPAPIRTGFPTLLQMPAPQVLVYPAVVAAAEKLHTIVHMGERNTRMKDFHDIRLLLEENRLDPQDLARAVRATFERRRTPVPQGSPKGLSDEFARDPARMRQWSAFHQRLGLAPHQSLEQAVGEIRSKLAPIFEEMAREADPNRRPPEGTVS